MTTAQKILDHAAGHYVPLAMPLDFYMERNLPPDEAQKAKQANAASAKKIAAWRAKQASAAK